MKTPEDILREGAGIIEEGVREESKAQGHYLTGAMENSLSSVAGKFGPIRMLTGTAVEYTQYVNNGVSAGRIPFKQGSGAGTSQYIAGLTAFWKLRGLSDKEALSAAFATAKTHKKEGMPSKGSYSHSSTGQRTSMIEIAITKKEKQLDTHIINGFDSLVEEVFQTTKSETV